MSNNVVFHERRKYKRFHAENGAFVSPKGQKRRVWHILDISRDGLAFRYIP